MTVKLRKNFQRLSFDDHRRQTAAIEDCLRSVGLQANRPDLDREAERLKNCALTRRCEKVQRPDGTTYDRHQALYCRSRFCALCMQRRQAKKVAQFRDRAIVKCCV